MDIAQLITPERVRCLSGISSRKRALESLGNLLGLGVAGMDPTDIFYHLIERERLGSTGVGNGVALPHARMMFTAKSDNDLVLGGFIKLDTGIDFDSPDSQPTDLLFALLVPEHCTDEHLQILAQLARMFSDSGFCQQLRNSQTDEQLFAQLSGWAQTHQAAS